MSHWPISLHLRRARLAFVWIQNCFAHECPETLWAMSCHLTARLREERSLRQLLVDSVAVTNLGH
ncbi:hypothetical protein PR003_g3227 [Phytophthora rubi]|uniref:Uncharacterized protein n=1 Tax=Phytophthora rubi TaxID=129364 RepID=A0A6A3LNL7_9STRA|nr:hypothetical protein PR002_g17205 [Phytophthora rubi]KAE9020936.1 hypothetical protein PR001_g13476 [Phytophthora rubi]KAE9354700.1 hypothetical protein PR003_g3227 [Phytophthora rubi]